MEQEVAQGGQGVPLRGLVQAEGVEAEAGVRALQQRLHLLGARHAAERGSASSAPGTRQQAPGTRHQAPGTRQQAAGSKML